MSPNVKLGLKEQQRRDRHDRGMCHRAVDGGLHVQLTPAPIRESSPEGLPSFNRGGKPYSYLPEVTPKTTETDQSSRVSVTRSKHDVRGNTAEFEWLVQQGTRVRINSDLRGCRLAPEIQPCSTTVAQAVELYRPLVVDTPSKGQGPYSRRDFTQQRVVPKEYLPPEQK